MTGLEIFLLALFGYLLFALVYAVYLKLRG